MSVEKLDLTSPDLVNQNIEKLAALFPNCVTEGADGKAIDFDLLKQELNNEVIEGNKERYRLEWPGKREAIVTANLPTTKTLRPIREDSVDFDNTENLYIEGDNLEVLKLLQESYLGKIKMIYIDPPYNTGKDFVYKDNFSKDTQEELVESGQKNEYNQRLVANPETAGRYHSDWLSMMYPRLKLARNLLTQDGAIFVSIDDNELENLKKILDEIFGNINFIGQMVWKKKYIGGKHAKHLVDLHEYVLVYARDTYQLDELLMERPSGELTKFNLEDEYIKERGKHYIRPLKSNLGRRDTLVYPIELPNGNFIETQWMVSRNTFDVLVNDGRIVFKKKRDGSYNVYRKYYEKDGGGKVKVPTLIEDVANADAKVEIKTLFEITEGREIPFDNPKPTKLLRHLINPIAKSSGDIILDFFSGSASTADAVMQLVAENAIVRNYIMVQLPQVTPKDSVARKAGFDVITDIAKERIRRAAKKINEETNADIDYGFRVYRLDSSNMEDVYYKPQDYDQSNLDLFADNVKSDRTADDLLAQVMLDWGLPLSLKIEQATISGKKVFKVAENSLYACFDSGIDEEFAKAIAKDEPLA